MAENIDHPATDADDVDQPSADVRQPDGDVEDESHDSRIVPVARLRSVRPVAVVFVLLNALLTGLDLPELVNILMLVPFGLVLGVVAMHRTDPAGLPGTLGRTAQGFLDQIAERPHEFWLLIGIVAVSCAQPLLVPAQWLAVGYAMNMALTLFIRGTEVGEQATWQHLVQTGKMRVVNADPGEPRPDKDMRPVIDSERDRKTWERRQHQRWEEWMKEEVDRLDDDDSA